MNTYIKYLKINVFLAILFAAGIATDITNKDIAMSNGNGPGYYHISCAEKLHIL